MFLRYLIATLLFCASLAVHADDAKTTPPQPPPKPAVSMDDIRAFTAVFNLVKQGYVEPVEASAVERTSLPSKPEVARRFLTSVQKIRGFDAVQARGNRSIPAPSRDAAE